MTKNRISEANYKRLFEANKPILATFFNNVEYLAIKQFGSRNEAIRQLKERLTYSMQPQTVKAFREGLYDRCDLIRLQAFCQLFNVDLATMITVDLSRQKADT